MPVLKPDLFKDELLGTLQYLASGNPIKLPKAGYGRNYVLQVSGNVTVAGASAGAVLADGMLRVLSEIIIKAGNQRHKVSSEKIHWLNSLMYAQRLAYTNPSAASNATYAVAATFILPEELVIGKNPTDTYLNLSQFASQPAEPVIQITFASNLATTLFDAAFDGTVTNTLKCDVYLSRAFVPGVTMGVVPKLFEDDFLVSAAGTDVTIPLHNNESNLSLALVLIMTMDAGERADGILTNLSVVRDTAEYRYHDLPDAILQQLWRQYTGQGTVHTGIRAINFMQDGLLESALPAQESSTRLVCDLALGSGVTRVKTLQWLLYR